jgi:hypothetical protein
MSVAVLAVAVAGSAVAGDLTTDNLTVSKDATFWGNLSVKDGSQGSAPTNGYILYYSFSTNTTPVPDDSGNGYTGTVSGATWVTNGTTGGAYSFDGTDDKLTAGDFGTITDITISVWLKKTDATASSALHFFEKSNSGATKYFNVYVDGPGGSAGADHVAFFSHNDGSNYRYVKSSTAITDTNWHYVVLTKTGSTLAIWIDGTDVTTAWASGGSLSPLSTGTAALIGRSDVYSKTYKGSIDETRLYNRVLSTAEIQSLYRNDAHLTAGTARFETGVTYVKPLGNVSMGIYTNQP